MPAARRSSRSRLRAQTATRIPAPARTRAVASPIPADAPVTMAILPASTVKAAARDYLPVTALTASWVTETMRSSCSSLMTSAGE